MAATASIKVTKTTPFIGQTKRWSNRYHINQPIPSGSTERSDLCDAFKDGELGLYPSYTDIVQVDLYDAGSDVPVYTKSYSAAGTASTTGGNPTPGDTAALLRFSTTQRTSKNHPIYLFNYYHSALYSIADGADVQQANQKASLEAWGQALVDGITVSGVVYKKAGPNGAVAQARFVEPYLTHRDFRR